MRHALLPLAVLSALVVGLFAFLPSSEPVPYITIESADLTFTEREYHQRVQRQIKEHGFQDVCVAHLLTLDPAAKTYSVNKARQNLVLVTECAAEEETFHSHEEE